MAGSAIYEISVVTSQTTSSCDVPSTSPVPPGVRSSNRTWGDPLDVTPLVGPRSGTWQFSVRPSTTCSAPPTVCMAVTENHDLFLGHPWECLLYTSDAADDLTRVDLGGCRIITKK